VAILISDPIDCKPKAVKRVKKALDSGKVVNSARENNNSDLKGERDYNTMVCSQ
jgi:hypothetical protein